MVSQANFFRDDISGELFPTPAGAIASERESERFMEGLFSVQGNEIMSPILKKEAMQTEDDGIWARILASAEESEITTPLL